MGTQCQHLTMLQILQKPEELFDITFGTCKTDPVDLRLKYYSQL